MAQIQFKPISPGAYAVFVQLFKNGPTWDGDIVDKEGRKELLEQRLAFRTEGWTSLSEDGVKAASMTSLGENKINRKQ